MKSARVFLALALVLILTTTTFAQQSIPTVAIFGKVTDAKTGEPLIGANVYIANSALGGATADDGSFVIFNVPYGKHKVLSSYIGYEVQSQKITVSSPEVRPVNFRLKTDVTQTGEVVVTEVTPDNWKENLRRFKRYFLGTSKNAAMCTILNPEKLDFIDEDGQFRALASEMLKIQNDALGYVIELHLEEFSVKNNEITMSYSPVFTEMSAQTLDDLKEWEEERKRAYHGSLRHFLAALADEKLDEEGFVARSTSSIILEDDPAYYTNNQSLKITKGVKEYEKSMLFDDYLMIVYKGESEEPNYLQETTKKAKSSMTYDPAIDKKKASTEQVSFLRQRVSPVKFNIKGILDDPLSMTTYGYFAWNRLADELPSDYNPAPVSSDLYIEEMRPETQWFAAMEEADSITFAWDYEYPIMLVLNKNEKRFYKGQKTLDGKKGFLKRLIKSKNKNPLFAVNYWFLEFSGRYYHAKKEFAIDEAPYYDIRGETYIKYGKPTQRYTDRGGLKRSKALNNRVEIQKFGFGPSTNEEDVKNTQQRSRSAKVDTASFKEFGSFDTVYTGKNKPDNTFTVMRNETWYYKDGSVNALLHFVRDGSNWKQVPRMTDFLQNKKQVNLSWHWMELVKEREHIGPVYGDYANQVHAFEEKIAHCRIKIMMPGNRIEIDSDYDINRELDGKVPDRLMTTQRIDSELYERNSVTRLEPKLVNRFDSVNELKFDYNVAQFKGENNKTRLEFTVHTPVKNVLNNRMTESSSDSITMNYQYIFRDSQFEPVIIRESSSQVSENAYKSAGLDQMVFSDTATIVPDSFDFTIQIEDSFSRNKGFRQNLQSIRDFSGDSLLMSDIVLFAAAEKSHGLLPRRTIDDIIVTPYPFNSLKQSMPAFCYFELYNLHSTGTGNKYKIDITAKSSGKKGIGKKLLGFLSRSKGVELSIAFDRTISEDESNELIALDFSEVKPGDYTLLINISDSNGKTILATTEKTIKVSK